MALTKVSTDGVKDDAITKTKIPANQIEASELADNAVDTNAIADQAVALSKLPHGTSSNDGKFLRANNGADPSFETVSIPAGTTINNNADNRVITGSGTANTLNGEANLTFDGNSLISTQTTSTSDCKFILRNSNTPATGSMRLEFHHGTGSTEGTNRFRYGFIEGYRQSGSNDGGLIFGTKPSNAGNPTERMRIDSSGKVGIGTTSPTSPLHLHESSSGSIEGLKITNSGTGSGLTDGLSIGLQSDEDVFIHNYENTAIHFGTNDTTRVSILAGGGLTFNGDTAAANALDDYEEGTWTPTITGGAITANGAYYTKVGRVVHWYLYGTITNTANNSTEFRIYGLPFTVGGNTQGLNNYYGGAASINYTQSANNGGLTNMGVLAHGSTNYLYFHFIGVGDSNQPTNSYFHSHMLNQGFIIAGSYFV